MTRECIEDFREIVLPFLSRTLLKTNYENMGKSDAEEFEKDFNEILDLAIKALEQEPTTKKDLAVDCIDRKATLDAIIKRLGIKNETYLLEGERVIYQQILAMPSVTPQEPKTGKWINTETKGFRYAFWCRYKCSLCGGLSDHTNFCPNCGAKLRGEAKTSVI